MELLDHGWTTMGKKSLQTKEWEKLRKLGLNVELCIYLSHLLFTVVFRGNWAVLLEIWALG